MFHFRNDDGMLAAIAGLVAGPLSVNLLEVLEAKKVLPAYLVRSRKLYMTNLRLWLATAIPAILACVIGIWLVLRAVVPENSPQTIVILAVVGFTTIATSFIKLIILKKSIRLHHDKAMKHLETVEAGLKELAEGPEIVDEELDHRVLDIKTKLSEARKALGVEKKDPNDL